VLDQAQARFELAQAQFSRTENLVEQGVISPQQFDEVKSNLDVARANLETARTNVRYTELRAPFAGTIAHVFVERFETVQPQRPIATLQMGNAIDVSIQVPEGLFARVQRQLDYQPDVIFAAAPEQRFKATLKEWDSTADPATNTYKVVFTLPTPANLNVLPGMSAVVAVDANAVSQRAEHSLVVPTTALFSPPSESPEQGHFVWVFDAQSETVQRRQVTVLALTNDGVEISSGLSAGERIVAAGVHALQNGQQVREWVKERGL
jgi:RND family efflux transporter MFP subunit